MRPIGFKIEKISGEKFKDIEGQVNVKTNFKIGDVTKEDIEIPEKEVVFSFNFTYTIEYEDVAQIEFSGQVFVALDKSHAKELEKDKTSVADDVRTTLLNFILFKTHVEALHLEERLGLPFHISSPRAQINANEKK